MDIKKLKVVVWGFVCEPKEFGLRTLRSFLKIV